MLSATLALLPPPDQRVMWVKCQVNCTCLCQLPIPDPELEENPTAMECRLAPGLIMEKKIVVSERRRTKDN